MTLFRSSGWFCKVHMEPVVQMQDKQALLGRSHPRVFEHVLQGWPDTQSCPLCETCTLWRASPGTSRETEPEFYGVSQRLNVFLPLNCRSLGTITAEAVKLGVW